MTRTYQKQCEAAARARAAKSREIRVFKRTRDYPGGPFVKTVDLGVMAHSKYKALKDSLSMCAYVGRFVPSVDGGISEMAYAEFVEYYEFEAAEATA